jgi:hypothetical protein
MDALSADISVSLPHLQHLSNSDLLTHVFATCCDNYDNRYKLSSSLVDVVSILRERRFFMTTIHETSTVRDLIKSACGATQKKSDTIERYLSSLVKCLRMPSHVFTAMPSISLSHLKLPKVVWYHVGDDVDMYFSDAWRHAIVVETKDVVGTNVNDVRIQYVGISNSRKNPIWVHKSQLRQHFPETAVDGLDEEYSAESIKEGLRCTKSSRDDQSASNAGSLPSSDAITKRAKNDHPNGLRSAIMPLNLSRVPSPDTLLPPSPANSHSSKIIPLTSSITLFEQRDVRLASQIVHKVREHFQTPQGPETFLEVLSEGKIRFPIFFLLTFLNRFYTRD